MDSITSGAADEWLAPEHLTSLSLRNIGGGVNYFAKYLLKDVKAWPTGRRVWSCSAGWRVKWSPRSPLAGKFAGQLLSTGEEFLSVSPWRYDRRESEAERRRLREGETEDG